MLILGLIVLGIAAGWVAQMILGGGGRRDWTEAAVAGLAGSFVGGLLFSLLAGDGLAIRPSGIVGSILGAVIVLAVWRRARSRRS
ncbi:MAG: GlsB/YeaQ/YmgE family stress response membrane protein [Acidimicrobiia bacterium]